MLVNLIPFIIAANISVNEIDWKYGAEVFYDVKIDATWNSLETSEYVSTLNTTTKLMCRPKSLWILSCRNYKRTTKLQDFNDRNESMIIPNTENFNVDLPSTEPFELYFDYGGLEKIVVSSSLKPKEIDAVRTIVDQFNIFVKTNVYEFQRVENSTTGECKTHYVISMPHDASRVKTDNKVYEMVLLTSGMEMPRGYVQKIKRTRYLDMCLHQYGYVYSSWKNPIGIVVTRPYDNIPSKPLETKFESSTSGLSLTDSEFSSYTEKVLILNDNTKPATAKLTERVTVTLDMIIPAKVPLSSIEYPVTVSIFPQRWILDKNRI